VRVGICSEDLVDFLANMNQKMCRPISAPRSKSGGVVATTCPAAGSAKKAGAAG